mmetsp:Transcript_11968/g.16229  ORF Transcript_11968/g.16229 Transcript_11968/m.16229 type:complete len:200 (-) Transcript_11968:1419-2018(-)
MTDSGIREQLLSCTYSTTRFEFESFERRLLYRALPNSDATIRFRRIALLIENILLPAQVPVQAPQHQFGVAPLGLGRTFHNHTREPHLCPRQQHAHTCELIFLGVHIHFPLELLVGQILHFVNRGHRFRISHILKHLPQLFFSAFRDCKFPCQVTVVVSSLPLLHLRSHFLLYGRRILRGLHAHHSHQVGDLHFRLRRI